MHGETVKDTW